MTYGGKQSLSKARLHLAVWCLSLHYFLLEKICSEHLKTFYQIGFTFIHSTVKLLRWGEGLTPTAQAPRIGGLTPTAQAPRRPILCHHPTPGCLYLQSKARSCMNCLSCNNTHGHSLAVLPILVVHLELSKRNAGFQAELREGKGASFHRTLVL